MPKLFFRHTLLLVILSIAYGCGSTIAEEPEKKTPEHQFYYKHWFKLTVQGSDTFLLDPCEGNNLQILFGHNANMMTMTWVDTNKVHRYNIYNQKEVNTKVKYFANNIDTKDNELFIITPKPNGYLCTWNYSTSDMNLGLFVDQEHKNMYATKKEIPCNDSLPN